ncbi:nSTAND1 domain-containing NTPase [Streptomyces sp. enrichment culture]|uniref:nSTAND1 domain-containing NTPase n=1 Tax=Streptomyces sp. enrichment culture TaxID=1795815 RepID=UPI003F5508C7
MSRKERPLDAGDGPLREFAAGLRQLRRKAGNPGYRTLAARAHYSISTLSAAASGRRLPTRAVTLAYVRACDGDVREWERRWRDVAEHLADGESAGESGPEPGVEGQESGVPPPYVGLRPFREQDSEWFFGRERLVRDLAERLERLRFVVVIGASGSGKSSLLRAGLVPRLRRTATVVVMTPGPRPVEECAVRLGALAGVPPGGLYEELRRDPANLDRVLRQIAARSPASDDTALDDTVRSDAVLVVDQFEEVFTLCRDDTERQCFVASLIGATPAGGGRCRVVLGVRADFYAHCVRDPLLPEAMREAQVPVGPMCLDELRRAVVRPAQRAGLTVEGALLASLSAQAQGQAGMLPLLSHALLETWRRRRGNALTLDAFEATGGLAGGLARTAEHFYARLPSGRQKLARQVFLRLTALGEGTEDTKRPAGLAELRGLTEQPDVGDDGGGSGSGSDDGSRGGDGGRSRAGGGDGDAVVAVLEHAARARLLTLDHERVELAHEVLIRCWPRLHGWLTEDREALRILRRLTDAAQTWETLGRDPGALYRGTRLATAATLDRASLSATEREFLDASRAAADREEAAARRTVRRLRRLSALLTVFLLTAAAATVYAVRAQDTATRQRNIALSQKVAEQAAALRSTNPALAARLSLAAYRLAPTTEARGSLLSTFATPYATRLTRHTDNVNAVAYRADSRTLVTGSNDHTARLWDITDPHRPRPLATLTGHTEKVSHAAFSPDGRTLATAGWDDTARLWSVARPDRSRAAAVLRGHDGDVNAVAFGPDGTALATAGTDGTVRLWDVTDPDRPRTTAVLPAGDADAAVVSVAFSPDGRTLAAAGFDNAVHLWTLDASGDAGRPTVLTGHTAPVSGVTFGPGGKTLASSGWDRTVRLWDLTGPGRPAPLATLTGPTDRLRAVAVSPDGRTLAGASLDHTVHVWDIGDPRHPKRRTVLRGHTAAAVSVAFGPDGRTLASAGDDQTVRLWDLPLPALHGHTDAVCAVALTPGGRTLATAGYDRTVRLWDVADPRRPRPLATLTGHADPVCGAAFAPGGRTLATAGYDRTVRLWDVTDPRHPRGLATLTGYGDHVNTVAFGPRGHTLATADLDGAVRLWDVTDTRHPRELAAVTAHAGGANAAVFSPDGTTLATGGWDRRLRLWNIGDPRRPRELAASPRLPDGVNAVAFHPDGTTLATTEFGGTTRLWRTGGRHLEQTAAFNGHVGDAHSPVFSPDGATLATTGADGTACLWDTTDPADPHPSACLTDGTGAGHTGAVFTAAFGPDGHTLATAGADGTARLWETSPRHVADRVCRLTHPALTRAEWNRHFENLTYRDPCP